MNICTTFSTAQRLINIIAEIKKIPVIPIQLEDAGFKI